MVIFKAPVSKATIIFDQEVPRMILALLVIRSYLPYGVVIDCFVLALHKTGIF